MDRQRYILANPAVRQRALQEVGRAPDGFRVEIKAPKRSTEQNDYMWALLTDVARQGQINGKKYEPEQWKCILMKALGHETEFLPTLDANGFFPTGFRSSDLTKAEMVALIEFIIAWAVTNNVLLHDGK